MSAQPEALRLADLWEKHSHGYARTPEARTAAELRRLSAENEAFNAENEKLRSERTLLVRKVEALETDIEIERRLSFRNQVAKLEDENEALLEALKMIAGTAPCIDNLMSDKDIARAAIKAVEEA